MAPSDPPEPGSGRDAPPGAASAPAVLAYFGPRLAEAPGDDALWARFAWSIGSAPGIRDVPVADAGGVLAAALVHPGVDPAALEPVVLSHLRRLPELGSWLREAGRATGPLPLPPTVARAAGSDEVLRAALQEALLPDPGFDRLVGALRRHLLLEPDPTLAGNVDLAVALARACFRRDYPYPTGADELAVMERLGAELGTPDVRDRADVSPETRSRMALLAAYRPLGRWPWAAALEARVSAGDSSALERLVAEQLRAPRREAELAAALPRLGEPPGVHHPVRAFYEAHPYPRWSRLGWREALDLATRIEVELLGRRPADLPSPARPDVLVAGCGTGLHPLAVRTGLRGASVTAIDLSRASLAYAARKAEELGITDLDVLQADLLELPGWERTFDVVESLGVLHHLADPAAGLAALAGRLRPGGLLKLGVYSRRGRTPMDRARAILGGLGLLPRGADDPVGDPGVRAAREALLGPLAEDEGLGPLRGIRDLYALSSFRDLLLHPVETAFDLTEIADLLRDQGLEFLGFADLPRQTLAAFRARFPAPGAETSLPAWDAFEAERPGTFVGMYRFWCRAPGRRA